MDTERGSKNDRFYRHGSQNTNMYNIVTFV